MSMVDEVNDAKQAKFSDLANRRVNRVIRNICEIGKLSDKRYYSYTDDQVKQIIDSLKNEIKVLKLTFKKNEKISNKKFYIDQEN